MRLFGSLVGTGLVLAAAMLPSIANAEPVTLRYGVIKASMGLFQSIALTTATEKGMLDREQVTLKVVPLAGTTFMIDELDKGNVDLSSTATPYLIDAALHGSDAVAVVGGPATTIYSLVARPEVKSFADLKGKAVALSNPTDVITISALKLLASKGIGPSDFVAKELIGTPQRSQCLESGECAAAPISQPDDFEYQDKGYNILANSHDEVPAMQFTVIAANRTWAAAHKDALVRFARAMGEAYKYVADPKNKDEVIKIAAKLTGATPEISTKVYHLYFEPNAGVLPLHGEINVAGVTTVIDLLGEAGKLKQPLPKAEQFVDLQYLQAAGMQ